MEAPDNRNDGSCSENTEFNRILSTIEGLPLRESLLISGFIFEIANENAVCEDVINETYDNYLQYHSTLEDSPFIFTIGTQLWTLLDISLFATLFGHTVIPSDWNIKLLIESFIETLKRTFYDRIQNRILYNSLPYLFSDDCMASYMQLLEAITIQRNVILDNESYSVFSFKPEYISDLVKSLVVPQYRRNMIGYTRRISVAAADLLNILETIKGTNVTPKHLAMADRILDRYNSIQLKETLRIQREESVREHREYRAKIQQERRESLQAKKKKDQDERQKQKATELEQKREQKAAELIAKKSRKSVSSPSRKRVLDTELISEKPKRRRPTLLGFFHSSKSQTPQLSEPESESILQKISKIDENYAAVDTPKQYLNKISEYNNLLKSFLNENKKIQFVDVIANDAPVTVQDIINLESFGDFNAEGDLYLPNLSSINSKTLPYIDESMNDLSPDSNISICGRLYYMNDASRWDVRPEKKLIVLKDATDSLDPTLPYFGLNAENRSILPNPLDDEDDSDELWNMRHEVDNLNSDEDESDSGQTSISNESFVDVDVADDMNLVYTCQGNIQNRVRQTLDMTMGQPVIFSLFDSTEVNDLSYDENVSNTALKLLINEKLGQMLLLEYHNSVNNNVINLAHALAYSLSLKTSRISSPISTIKRDDHIDIEPLMGIEPSLQYLEPNIPPVRRSKRTLRLPQELMMYIVETQNNTSQISSKEGLVIEGGSIENAIDLEDDTIENTTMKISNEIPIKNNLKIFGENTARDSSGEKKRVDRPTFNPPVSLLELILYVHGYHNGLDKCMAEYGNLANFTLKSLNTSISLLINPIEENHPISIRNDILLFCGVPHKIAQAVYRLNSRK